MVNGHCLDGVDLSPVERVNFDEASLEYALTRRIQASGGPPKLLLPQVMIPCQYDLIKLSDRFNLNVFASPA